MKAPETYTPIQVETALSVFEWLIDRAKVEPWAELFEDHGWAQMRLNAIDTAVWIERVTDGLEFDVAYDWEVIPFLMELIDPEEWADLSFGGCDCFPVIHTTRAALLARFPSTKIEKEPAA